MDCLDIKVFHCNIVFIFKYLTVIIQCKIDCIICKFYIFCLNIIYSLHTYRHRVKLLVNYGLT